ncbi:PREDICTED: trichohyalin-like [Branchiostoma belcheri]|uniref:Trichohyalin-like n=1 Tax=Branchiostoma belcheri TaxID=7741 RepID=A0A6P4Y1I9_BRABE|nr:PREDICTED: trichohyalin-like [Branchiostoma belcheri]
MATGGRPEVTEEEPEIDPYEGLDNEELKIALKLAEEETRGLYADLKTTMEEHERAKQDLEQKLTKALQEKQSITKERDAAVAKLRGVKDDSVAKDHRNSQRIKDLQSKLQEKTLECKRLLRSNELLRKKLNAQQAKMKFEVDKEVKKFKNQQRKLEEENEEAQKEAKEAAKKVQLLQKQKEDEARRKMLAEERLHRLERENELMERRNFMTERALEEAVRKMKEVRVEKAVLEDMERDLQEVAHAQLELAASEKEEKEGENLRSMRRRELERTNKQKSQIKPVQDTHHVQATLDMKAKFLALTTIPEEKVA